jgi:hypothetical protein
VGQSQARTERAFGRLFGVVHHGLTASLGMTSSHCCGYAALSGWVLLNTPRRLQRTCGTSWTVAFLSVAPRPRHLNRTCANTDGWRHLATQIARLTWGCCVVPVWVSKQIYLNPSVGFERAPRAVHPEQNVSAAAKRDVESGQLANVRRGTEIWNLLSEDRD